MPLCLVALVVFSVMSIWSAKYRRLAKEAFKCVRKTLMLSPCDMAFEQKVKAKVTAKLLNISPTLARGFYQNFRIFAWAFTASFFVSLFITAYSFYNYAVYGSCDPGEPCYMTALGVSIGVVEKYIVYAVVAILIVSGLYVLVNKIRRR
jgi:phosphatidylglycerophosphate synthase